MKRLALIAILFTGACFAQSPPSQAAGYQLVWQDTFATLSLASGGVNTPGYNWYQPSEYGFTNTGAITDPSGTYVNINNQLSQGGYLSQIGTACTNGGCGRAWSPPFYVEASALFNPITGNWPAIWMQPIQQNQTQIFQPSNNVNYGEIDLLEWQSNNPLVGYSTVHVWKNGSDIANNSGSNTWTMPGGTSNFGSYNTYGVLVTTSAISWYLNNTLLFTVSTTSSPYNQAYAGQLSYFLMLAEQAGCNFTLGTCSGMAGPFNLQVQWVHVFQGPQGSYTPESVQKGTVMQ